MNSAIYAACEIHIGFFVVAVHHICVFFIYAVFKFQFDGKRHLQPPQFQTTATITADHL